MAITVSNDEIIYDGTTEDFKKDVVRKFLDRKDKSAESVAENVGVTVKTLYNWSDKYAIDSPMKKKKYSATAKMKLIIEYDSLPEEKQGEFLRVKGLYSEELNSWREQVLHGELENLTESILRKKVEKQNKQLSDLQKELKRKEKALVEASALLLLKKKAEEYFGMGDDEDEE